MAQLITENGSTFIRDEWSADDIQSVAEINFDLELTHEQVLQVMNIVVEEYDCNNGISWDTIDTAIEYVLNHPGEVK